MALARRMASSMSFGAEDHGDGAENFLVHQFALERDIREDAGGDIGAGARRGFAAGMELGAEGFGFVELLQHRVALLGAGERAHIGFRRPSDRRL